MNWTDLGSTSEVIINNMPAGEYLVQIRGADRSMNRAIMALEIPIHVNEFFYREWWFYLFVTLPFLIGAIIWVKRVRSENKRLEVEVDRRTAQIQSDATTIQLQLQR